MPSATLRADGNGLLSVDEVAKDVHRLGLVIPDGEVGKNKLFAKLDTDSSRTVTMVEFLPFVLKYSPDTRDAKVTVIHSPASLKTAYSSRRDCHDIARKIAIVRERRHLIMIIMIF